MNFDRNTFEQYKSMNLNANQLSFDYTKTLPIHRRSMLLCISIYVINDQNHTKERNKSMFSRSCFFSSLLFFFSSLDLRNWHKHQKPLEKNKMAFWLGLTANNQVDVPINRVGTDFYSSKNKWIKKTPIHTYTHIQTLFVFTVKYLLSEPLYFQVELTSFFRFRINCASFAHIVVV